MASVDNSHWIIIKKNKIHERKKLLDKNADIRRKIGSPSFTDAQKITLRQDLKQNQNKIKTLDDQINGIESNISSKATNDILPTDTVRGRSQTREPKHRYASPSPPQRSPRSVSSSSSRKKNHPTDDNKLGIMQRLLETYKAENARLERQINSQESKNQEKLREVEDEANFLQKEYDDMKAAYQRACLNEETLKWKLAELTRQNQDNKTSALKNMTQNQRIKDLQSMIEDRNSVEKRLRSKISKQEQEYETKLREYEVKNEELKSKLTKEMMQCESLQASIRQHKQKRDQHSIVVEKAYEQNANLSERLKIETEDKAKLQMENKRLKTEIDSTRREKDDWGRGISERLANLQREYDNLQEAYNRERRNIETLKLEENKMKRTLEEMQRRNEALERNAKENEASTLTQIKLSEHIIQLQANIKENDLVQESLRNNVDDLEKENRELQCSIKQIEAIHKKETDTIQQRLTELQKKFHLIQEERDNLRESEEKERQIGEKAQQKLEDAKREKEKLQERIEELESIKQLEAIHKKETDTIQQRLTELQKKFHLIQEERDNLRESEEKERQIGEKAQQKLEDAKREKEKLQERIEELESFKQLEAIHKKETDTIQQRLTELQKKFHLIQEERDNLRESEEKERQIGEKAQQKLEDAKREKEKLQERIEELESIKQLEAIHKKETDTIQQKLTELQKKFHLIQEERDSLRESEEKERQRGEKAQQKLEDAKREKEKLQERIEELERETPAIKTEEFYSLNLTSATASHEFHTIFKREWMDAFKVLSNSGLQENDILLGLQGVLTKCVGDAVLECSEITKRVCRYRYFQTDPSPTLVKMLKLAGLKAVVPHKTKQMLENISTEDHGIPIPVPLAVKTYVQRCTEMTLLVRMLFPQLSIVADMESSHLNTQQFEVFSGEGNLIDVVVWPYIMKNGTVVQKGYVKVRSSKQTPSVSKNKEGATGISKSNDISDNEDHKYSDIEGTLIYKRDDEGKDESRNDTGSESANSMAESLTNYDLTSDFLNSFSIRQQLREDDVAGK